MKKYAIDAAEAHLDFKRRFEGKSCGMTKNDIKPTGYIETAWNGDIDTWSAVNGTARACTGVYNVTNQARRYWAFVPGKFFAEPFAELRIVAQCTDCGFAFCSKWYREGD